MKTILTLLALAIVSTSCREDSYTAKPEPLSKRKLAEPAPSPEGESDSFSGIGNQ